jgi:anti-sigma-K factor RskA
MTNGHPTREEDFDLYVLGALEGDEKQAIESHLAVCAECARKLTAARGRVAAISFAAPRTEPSPAVKDRLLRQIRAEANPPASAPVRQFVTPEPPRNVPLPWRWQFAILAPACAALMFFSLYLWRQNDHLNNQLAEMRANMAEQQKQLEYARIAAHLVEAKDTVTVSLAPMPGMPKGAAHVMYNPQMGMLMYDGWIDPPPQDKSYQLWVVPMEGKPISAGVFNPATSDTAHWMTKVPEGVAVKTFAVTLEPAGGMPEPTGPMVLAGT